MAKITETAWGRSIDILGDLPEEKKEKAYSGGVNQLDPQGRIPLHLHTSDSEEYIPQTGGIKILVLPKEEYFVASEEELYGRLKATTECEIGEVVTCPKGYAHMAINDSNNKAALVFLKYKEEE